MNINLTAEKQENKFLDLFVFINKRSPLTRDMLFSA